MVYDTPEKLKAGGAVFCGYSVEHLSLNTVITMQRVLQAMPFKQRSQKNIRAIIETFGGKR